MIYKQTRGQPVRFYTEEPLNKERTAMTLREFQSLLRASQVSLTYSKRFTHTATLMDGPRQSLALVFEEEG